MTRLLLVGAMGSGKTAVGTSLATKTGWPYVDNDALLLRSSGLTAPALLARDGEAGLHAAEATVLTLQLGIPGSVILGISGGAVLEKAARERLRAAGQVVWLRASPTVLARRIGNAAGRPLVGEPLAALTRLAAERNAFYAEVATETIDVDLITAGVAAKAILAAFGLTSLGDHAPRR